MPAEPLPTIALPVAFARLLRRRGLPVPSSAAATFARALTVSGVDRRSSVYWAGRATLVRRPEEVPTYDDAFAAFWDASSSLAATRPDPTPVTVGLDGEPEDEGGERPEPGDDPDRPVVAVRFSPVERLRQKDFAACDADERAELHRAIARLRVGAPTRRSRRLGPVPAGGRRPDPRRTLRAALRTGGEPIRRPGRVPLDRPRPLVLLVDVSGSMEPYSRALVRFAHAAVVGGPARRRVEVFTLGTRLTRVTRSLGSHDPDAALATAGGAVADWSGGTRLGDTIAAFNDGWGVRGLARGAVVVILSDGWDRGDPATMAEQMQRLARVAHRVVWVNPLRAGPGYAPLVRGMAAALPHVDAFVDGHSLASLEALASVLDDDTLVA